MLSLFGANMAPVVRTAMNSHVLDLLMERMRQQTLVDLVQLPYLRAPPIGKDVVRILQALQSSAIESLRLPVLHEPQLEALQECLTANPTIRMISVKELTSNMAYTYFCQAMVSHATSHVEIGRADLISTKDVSIVGCNALANMLETSSTIQQLCLTSLRLCRPRIFARGLSQSKTLRVIKLCNVQMDDLTVFLQAIEKLPLESLSLDDMEIDTEGDTSCCSDTSSNDSPWLYLPQTLRQLCLTECSLCSFEVKALCDGLVDLPRLTHLTLSICDLLPSAATHLRDLIANSQSLAYVNLEQNSIGTSGASSLVSFGSTTKPLSLNLQSNGIRELVFYDSCHSLDLSDNPLGPSIPHQSPQLSSPLKKLHLNGCCLTDTEIVALCHVIPASVAELGLANNVVHRPGAEAIRMLLESNLELSSIDLSSCHIDDTTIGHLLPRNVGENQAVGGLRELYLAFNKIQNAGMMSIANYLQHRYCQLHTLNLQFNDFNDVGLRHIELVLSQRNKSLCHWFFWNSSHHTLCANNLEQRIDHWLALNRAGRRALPLMSDDSKPNAYWTPILAHADRVYGVSGLFYMLKNRPDLVYEQAATVAGLSKPSIAM